MTSAPGLVVKGKYSQTKRRELNSWHQIPTYEMNIFGVGVLKKLIFGSKILSQLCEKVAGKAHIEKYC